MSKGLDMLRDYIEHDALCMRRRKCCEIENVLMQEMDVLRDENAKLREYVQMLAKVTVYDLCEWCQYDGDGTCGTETEPMREGCRLYAELRLMGVEVEE